MTRLTWNNSVVSGNVGLIPDELKIKDFKLAFAASR